ncbi:hypothetical protein LSH36_1290g00042 [Paralvinella palmiformis]|uniref:Uncharacterized protein n=1 Tax=Paralvinella palmiformis TaxID=53620 RepID=A0AAD9IV20_9ANNE|nr:hypothetical protein LSH36_1290g00042 [Paralvinella palmiformis]
MIPQKTRIKRETVRTVYDFMTTVALVDSKAKRLLFSFWMYDGDVLLTSLPTVVKINKDDYEIFDNYLKIQGLYLTKLRNNDNIIACLGMTSDLKLLIMEVAPLGNLRQYLEMKANEMFDIMTQCWMRQPYNRPSLHDISVKCNELIQYEEV